MHQISQVNEFILSTGENTLYRFHSKIIHVSLFL